MRLDVSDLRGRARRIVERLRTTRCCAGPLGTVRPLVRPSWFIADPRMIESTVSPAAIASERRLSTTTPQPSPRT